MRKVTMALLAGASICLSGAIAMLVWRAGGGAAAAAAGMSAGLALALTLQGLVGRLRDQGAVQREMSLMRDANLVMADTLEEINARLGVLTEAVEDKAVRSSEELTSEVRMLETLVHRMTESLEDRLAAPAVHGPSPRR